MGSVTAAEDTGASPPRRASQDPLGARLPARWLPHVATIRPGADGATWFGSAPVRVPLDFHPGTRRVSSPGSV